MGGKSKGLLLQVAGDFSSSKLFDFENGGRRLVPSKTSRVRNPRKLVLSLSTNGHDSLSLSRNSHEACKLCNCRRRDFLGALGSGLLLNFPENAQSSSISSESTSKVILNKIHPPKSDWYEEFYAIAMDQVLKSYEPKVAGYKEQLFSYLKGDHGTQVLELGVGTGPNFKYYATSSNIHVLGVDPNMHMEKYARNAALNAGLPSTNFDFMQGVGEALPAPDASMDIVVGTLVLCSVKDVAMALREVKRVLKRGGCYIFVEHVAAPEGSSLRYVQGVLDPLQQLISDGCHLIRDTGKEISNAGFSNLNLNKTFVSNLTLISPHVYGVAYK
ncbi:methyltransferase-like protein 7B isoform X1 [Amborella trichopoda]|uniref:Methyltransferase type 11 domain-containing protein n=1 Tax=Amborella trichopoda TaxID=13333 RepID=W1NH84_AMBTC|nr:methyltransferase-like protein 7B isoform X1 [Amborella trichopoda]ERM94535.1 hypothetical protein AMTR_s00010p00265430 [Amborella trichopoda]|eukprot:XP_006827298.1 methyltransferase-like protein 7B isoform X1 [Amborella trichopoda]